jgi:hypothetical protein
MNSIHRELIHMQYEPDFDCLHSDERYREIVRKVGLPPAFRGAGKIPNFLLNITCVTVFSPQSAIRPSCRLSYNWVIQ